MKRFALVLALSLALSLVFVGSAFANFGPHGGYATDTDSCAGCHRAHTSFSQVTFTPSDPGVGGAPYALLVGSGTTITEFCYACHGDAAPGASTNVESGVFDGSASAPATGAINPATGTLYMTDSTDRAPLNGGGFATVAKDWNWDSAAVTSANFAAATSNHNMDVNAVIWGSGDGANESAFLTCISCHDPHGSSNYRLLKDSVNGNAVGGYDINGVPNGAYVWSTETGYPVAAEKGWLKGNAGATQMLSYVPNYTNGGNIKATVTGSKSLSAWCSGCHEGYDNQSSAKDYLTYEANGALDMKTRHRHPVNITLVQGDPILAIPAQAGAVVKADLDQRLPLEAAGLASVRQDQVGCLTCHLAHGSSQTMTGWAAASLDASGLPVIDGVAGVDPAKSAYEPGGAAGTSALLRADNRGVCERCHNK
ncbi:MAG: cytochrome c3 family protein [Coriobacteriia bacterium]|nr:cytochrome c3 family protein [Coriobacteriia bacterium]